MKMKMKRFLKMKIEEMMRMILMRIVEMVMKMMMLTEEDCNRWLKG